MKRFGVRDPVEYAAYRAELDAVRAWNTFVIAADRPARERLEEAKPR